MDRFLSTERRQLLYWAAICAAGALLTRYLGVTLIGSGVLILLTQRNLSWRTRLLNTLIYSCVAVTLFGVWILRNIFTIGSLLGRVHPDEFSLLNSLHIATSEISMWVYGVSGLEFLNDLVYELMGFTITDTITVPAIVLRAAILAYTVIGVVLLLSRYRPGTYERNREMLVVCLWFISVYSLYFAVHLPASDVVLSDRYLITLFPFILVIAAVALDGFISKHRSIKLKSPFMNTVRTRVVSIPATLIVCLWTLSWIGPNYDYIKIWNDNGRGYRSKGGLESEVVQYLNANPRDGVIWSNQHAALYYLISNSDDKEIYRLPLELLEAVSIMSDNHSVGLRNSIVWFYWQVYHILPHYSLEELGVPLGLEVEVILRDGFILQSGGGGTTSSDTEFTTWDDDDFYFNALINDTSLIIDSHFDVYLDVQHNRLLYVRESPCSLSDIEPRFMLHVFPVEDANSIRSSKVSGFIDLDFQFGNHGIPIVNYCIAIRSLPPHSISTIKTGQINGNKDIWYGEYHFTDDPLRGL